MLKEIGEALPPHAAPVLLEIRRWLREGTECLVTAVARRSEASRLWHARAEQVRALNFADNVLHFRAIQLVQHLMHEWNTVCTVSNEYAQLSHPDIDRYYTSYSISSTT